MFKLEEFLPHVFLFSNLSTEEIEKLAQHSTVLNFKKNDFLFHQGDAAQAFFVIAFGKVKIFRLSPEGQEQIIHIHQEREVLAEAAIFNQIRYPANAQAVKDSMAVKIAKDAFLAMIEQNPQIALKFLSGYARRLREFVAMVEYLSLDDIPKRVAKYLLQNSTANSWEMNISKKEWAHLLGTTPETVSRILAKFKKNKLISEKNKILTITDRDKLQKLVGRT
jgi:CRP/FNR family transcriptional regulator, dissimilatory nitrate respiration regulator